MPIDVIELLDRLARALPHAAVSVFPGYSVGHPGIKHIYIEVRGSVNGVRSLLSLAMDVFELRAICTTNPVDIIVKRTVDVWKDLAKREEQK